MIVTTNALRFARNDLKGSEGEHERVAEPSIANTARSV